MKIRVYQRCIIWEERRKIRPRRRRKKSVNICYKLDARDIQMMDAKDRQVGFISNPEDNGGDS